MPREQSLVRDQGGGQGVQGGGGGGLERNNNSEGKGIFKYIYITCLIIKIYFWKIPGCNFASNIICMI